MKNVLKFPALLLALFTCTGALQSQNAADETAVYAVVREGFDAFNAYDADRFAALFTEKAYFINPMGGMLNGREEIRQGHAQLFAMWGKPEGRSYTWSKQKIRFLNADLALVSLQSEGKATVAGKTETDNNAFSFLLSRNNGKWLVENIQITPVLPMPGK